MKAETINNWWTTALNIVVLSIAVAILAACGGGGSGGGATAGSTPGVASGEIEGFGSLYPTLKAGVGFESETMIFDILGGVGYLWNDAFTATTYSGDLFLRLKVDQKGVFTVGPHVGAIYFNPDWDGTAQVSLDSDTGIVGGIAFTVGSPRVAFSAALDYVSAEFDVSTSGGWTANESKLDISGFQVVLGVQFRF